MTDLLDKLRSEGIITVADLLQVSNRALSIKLKGRENFNRADLMAIMQMCDAARKSRDASGLTPRSFRCKGAGGASSGCSRYAKVKWNGRDKSGDKLATRRQGGSKPLLWTAVESGDVNSVRAHLFHGLDRNERFKGWTPLVKAAEEGHVDITMALLDIGVNKEAANRNGRTALSFAAAPSKSRPANIAGRRLLLQQGCDASHRDAGYLAAEDRAAMENLWDALSVFEELRNSRKSVMLS